MHLDSCGSILLPCTQLSDKHACLILPSIEFPGCLDVVHGKGEVERRHAGRGLRRHISLLRANGRARGH